MKKRDVALAVGGGLAAAVAVKMLMRPESVDFDTVRDHVPHADRSHFVTVDGTRIHYQDFGDPADPPIILLHGYTASVYVWRLVAPRLAEAGHRVIALDLPGFGYSEKPAWFDYSIVTQARVVSRFMDTLGIGRATVVGSSYGGAIAATLALDYAARVEKLVLVDAVTNDDVRRHPLLRLASIPGIGEVITPYLVESRVFHRYRMRRTVSPANYSIVTSERVENVRRPLAAADGHRSVLATSRHWNAERIERDAYLIDHPTLLVWGEDDKVIPIANAFKLYDSILHSRLVVLKDCGHLPQEEKSELFADLVAEFCADEKGRVSEGGREVSLAGK
jgi:pimeloyl-ACP methyl ester carboxylesterase